MQINPDYNTAAYTIRSYDTGEIVVYEPVTAQNMEKLNAAQGNGQKRINTRLLKLTSAFIITPGKLIEDWQIDAPQSLSESHLENLLSLKPELVILGTGTNIHFPSAEQYLYLQQKGIGLEVMNTSAACRTYNFLVADGRNVAAGIFTIT